MGMRERGRIPTMKAVPMAVIEGPVLLHDDDNVLNGGLTEGRAGVRGPGRSIGGDYSRATPNDDCGDAENPAPACAKYRSFLEHSG
jgi:hypothetical protein